MSIRAITLFFFAALLSGIINAQISAPSATASFPTEYSSGFISSGGQNDLVYVFCGNQDESNVGELQVNAAGGSVSWYQFDGISFSPMGQTGSTISNLGSGCYMARVTTGGTTTCYRAWVWVNQSYVEVDPIPPGCETFTLSGSYEVLDNTFTIVDPPGSNFEIDENTYIKICFWATHTYVSDIGFYLKAPDEQLTEPGNDGVVQLCPSASDWGPNAAQGSWTGIPWSTLGCSDPSAINTVCNSGNNVSNFCFATHVAPGGPELPAGNPTYTPCVCDMPTPLTGTYASVGPWSTIYGANAADPGWSVQIYDCEAVDYGTLTQATITFIGDTECGEAMFTYNSGSINSAINDNSCDAASASLYVVPPGEPAGEYQVTSEITNIQWSCDELPGWSSDQNPVTVESSGEFFPQQSTQYTLTVYEQINVQGSPQCAASASEYFETLPADATIDPVDPLCYNAPPYQLSAEDGGGVWTSTTPNAINGNMFVPGNVTPGEHEVTYTIDGPCSDEDNITITVYDIINITPPITECNPTNTAYSVTFDVTNSQGNPSEFFAVWNDGSGTFTGTFDQEFPNETIYNITVTDINNCSQHVLNGFYACDCETYAGTMVNLQPLHMCDGECTGTDLHNGNHFLDGDDILEFIIHDGQYPPTIYATNNSSNFCQNDIPGGAEFGTTYYISAIAGNNVGGHVDHTDVCYSQSIGKPVIWHTVPIATISTNESSTCGLTYCIEANEPTGSITGNWTATHSFVPTGGGSSSDNEMCVLVNDYNDVTFTWTLSNGYCSGTDDVTIHFLATPNAYAGVNQTVCGFCTTLEAVYSLSGTTGIWSGAGGTFSSSLDPNAEVCVNQFGTYIFKWRESNSQCFDEDNVTITFLQEPQPNISLDSDTVCGVTYNLSVDNVIGEGEWNAYDYNTGIEVFPFFANEDSTSTIVVVPAYENHADTLLFEWVEVKEHEGIQCFGSASIVVVFAEQPSASVGNDNQGQSCGNQFTFAADTLGTGWANGTWIGKDILPVAPGEQLFDDQSDPFATVTIDSLASFGDSAHVEVTFLWIMSNASCTDIDTMYVTFYQHPNANAGLDNEVCGLIYELGAVWSIPATDNYEPTGWWTFHSGPANTSVNIHNENSDTTLVNVSLPGVYQFVWRESNSVRPSCYSTDTVTITFIEIPLIDAGEDFDVCGPCTPLNCVSAGFPGSWQPIAGVTFSPNQQDPQAEVCSSIYGSREFIWQESNQQCVERDTVIVTFWRVPTAEILTDEADSTTCGYCFRRLQAGNPGAGIEGFWWSPDEPNATFSQATQTNPDTVCVTTYGYKDFYWIEETGPETAEPGFCTDTAGPLNIRFIQIPEADAGIDTLFCGYCGYLDANPSIGLGTWTTPSTLNLTFDDPNLPDSRVCTSVLTDDNPNHDYYNIVWTEDNSNGCTDSDTIQAVFARIPKATFAVRPPKCFGEWASFIAIEDSLPQYQWVFEGAHIDSIAAENDIGGDYKHYVSWINTTDTAHFVSLVVTGSRGCTSSEVRDTVYEPQKPEYLLTVFPDTCALGKGGVRFSQDTISNSFEWLNPEEVGITPTHIYDSVQYNIPAGEYYAATVYTTFNLDFFSYYVNNFGTAYCYDTVEINIDYIGMIEASFEVAADVDINSLVAPNAEVWFVNNSDYDEVRKRCEWHFGDDERLNSCDELVSHTYTTADCFEPFLIVMNRDLPECRDTAYIDFCIPVDDKSDLEIPNIFTPNGDGINDYFQVKAKTLEEFKGVIVNRWGREVYTWENWQDMEAGWDGKLSGGSDASPGVYYYIIKAVGIDGLEYDEQGPLHLMREK